MDTRQLSRSQQELRYQQERQRTVNQQMGSGRRERVQQPVNQQANAQSTVRENMPPAHSIQRYPESHLGTLQRLGHMNKNTVKHIFIGEINREGRAVGYHYEGIEGSRGTVISERRDTSVPGVYTARVSVDNVEKEAASTFFPARLEPQMVVDGINHAYANRRHLIDNLYRGESGQGFDIDMRLRTPSQSHSPIIATAYPVARTRQRRNQQNRGQSPR